MNTQRKQLSTTNSIVLVRLINGGRFQEFPGNLCLLDPRSTHPAMLAGRSRERLARYKVAIAEKWETLQGLEYWLLYHPMEGWIELWQRT